MDSINPEEEYYTPKRKCKNSKFLITNNKDPLKTKSMALTNTKIQVPDESSAENERRDSAAPFLDSLMLSNFDENFFTDEDLLKGEFSNIKDDDGDSFISIIENKHLSTILDIDSFMFHKSDSGIKEEDFSNKQMSREDSLMSSESYLLRLSKNSSTEGNPKPVLPEFSKQILRHSEPYSQANRRSYQVKTIPVQPSNTNKVVDQSKYSEQHNNSKRKSFKLKTMSTTGDGKFNFTTGVVNNDCLSSLKRHSIKKNLRVIDL